MKHLISIFTFVLFFQVVTQEVKIISGVATYKSLPNSYTGKKGGKHADIFREMYKLIEDMNYTLIFNNNESLFNVEEGMGNDSSPSALSIAKGMVTQGSYYTNLKEMLLIRKVETGGEELLISIKSSPTNPWKITKDTKLINNFKCFKAIKNKTIINPKGSFNFEIVAWFAPEIPVRFGPKEFNNLPGLILELQDTHHNFYIDKIEFLKKPPKIAPFKGDIITEEEYFKITNDNLSAFRGSLKKN